VLLRLQREEALAGRPMFAKQSWAQVLENLDRSASERLRMPFSELAPELRQTIINYYREAERLGNQRTSDVGTQLQDLKSTVESAMRSGAWTPNRDVWLKQLDQLQNDLDYAFGLDRDQGWPRLIRADIFRLKNTLLQVPHPQDGQAPPDPKLNFLFVSFDKGIQIAIGLVPNIPLRWTLMIAWEYVKQLLINRDGSAPAPVADVVAPGRRSRGRSEATRDVWSRAASDAAKPERSTSWRILGMRRIQLAPLC
jgi:hypothetical protein